MSKANELLKTAGNTFSPLAMGWIKDIVKAVEKEAYNRAVEDCVERLDTNYNSLGSRIAMLEDSGNEDAGYTLHNERVGVVRSIDAIKALKHNDDLGKSNKDKE